jgi:hypothetical protein
MDLPPSALFPTTQGRSYLRLAIRLEPTDAERGEAQGLTSLAARRAQSFPPFAAQVAQGSPPLAAQLAQGSPPLAAQVLPA